MIVEALKSKACTKQKIYDKTLDAFNQFKKQLQLYVNELQDVFTDLDPKVQFEYRDSGTFECSIKFSGDTLVYTMHTNIFNFEENHAVHQMPYVQENPLNSYCGMIEIHNFLSDSFKYQRLNDTGYLIARIFINQDNHFFVELSQSTEIQSCPFPRNLNFLWTPIAASAAKRACRRVLNVTRTKGQP